MTTWIDPDGPSYEWAAKATFHNGTHLIDSARFGTRAEADHRAAEIRVKYPPHADPGPEDVQSVAVVSRYVGAWKVTR